MYHLDATSNNSVHGMVSGMVSCCFYTLVKRCCPLVKPEFVGYGIAADETLGNTCIAPDSSSINNYLTGQSKLQ